MRSMTWMLFSVLVLSSAAFAEDSKCTVKISGAFEGTVPCKVTYMGMGGEFHLGLGAGATPKPVTATLLVDFKEAPAAKTYGFDALSGASGSASAETKKGTVWELIKGGPSKIPGAPAVKQKGEVALTLTATGKHPADFHGHATATLVPNTLVGAAEKAPVKVEIDF